MPKFDFFNKNYYLHELADGYADGDTLYNFKGDKDFLDFLISYTVGDNLEGPEADQFKEYAKYKGLLSIALLDQYDLLGKSLYKIYEICGKDKLKFIRTCHHIGEYTLKHTFERTTIETNLKLSNPVSFIDEDLVLSDGTKPVYDYDNGIINPYHLPRAKEEEYEWELERSLRRRINDSIKVHSDEIEPLEEMVSFVEKERNEQEEIEAKRVKEDHLININDLYFGKQTLDISGGVLGMNMTLVSWFEDTKIGILCYRAFRSVPAGDYCLLDKENNLHLPEEIVTKGDIRIGPNSPVRKVEIASVPRIFELGIESLEIDSSVDEETLLRVKGLYEMLQIQENILVEELEQYEPIIRVMYENVFGKLFKSETDQDGYNGELPKGNSK